MNNKTLYHEKTLPFRVIFNVAIIFKKKVHMLIY